MSSLILDEEGADVLVNNAGIVNFGRIDEYSYEQWDHVINVNLNGVFNGIKAAIPALKASGSASVTNVSLIAEGLVLTTSHVALNRVGRPEEIAELVLYLSGAESSFVAGAQFVSDEGETAGLAHHPMGEAEGLSPSAATAFAAAGGPSPGRPSRPSLKALYSTRRFPIGERQATGHTTRVCHLAGSGSISESLR